jgi:hypothetical protein
MPLVKVRTPVVVKFRVNVQPPPIPLKLMLRAPKDTVPKSTVLPVEVEVNWIVAAEGKATKFVPKDNDPATLRVGLAPPNETVPADTVMLRQFKVPDKTTV